MIKVVLCLAALSRHAPKSASSAWPHAPIGAKLSSPAPRASFPSASSSSSPQGAGWNTAQYGYTGGANQSKEGVRIGAGRDAVSGAKAAGGGGHHYYGA